MLIITYLYVVKFLYQQMRSINTVVKAVPRTVAMNFFSSVTVQGQFQYAIFQMCYREGAGRSFHRTFTSYKTTFDRIFTAKGSLVVNFSGNVGQPRLVGLLCSIALLPDDMYYFLCNKTN